MDTMTKTYAVQDTDGTWNYILGLGVLYTYDPELCDDRTFVVVPVFEEGSTEGDINTIHITMDEETFTGGDAYSVGWERASIASEDTGKYTIIKKQTTIESGVTGYTSGDYVVEPGDTLYYTIAFKADQSSGYRFAGNVSLAVNGVTIADAASDGETVRFQDVIWQPADGGVTKVSFNQGIPGRSVWSAAVDYYGISRSKENLAAARSSYFHSLPERLWPVG